MKSKTFVLIISLLCWLASPTVGSGQSKQYSAEDVLKKVSEKLLGLKTIRYGYRRELNYASEKYYAETKADAFLDFTSIDKVIGARYQFSNQDTFDVFNGSEMFSLNKKNKTIEVNDKPIITDFSNRTFLYNSLLTLRNVLPKIISDGAIPKSLSETVINGTDFYVVEFTLDKYLFDPLGNFPAKKLSRKINYRITISKTNFMPVEVVQKNGETDFIKTNFNDIEINPKSPPVDLSWNFSTYLNDYKYAKPPEDNLIKVGEVAPEFGLPSFENDALTALSQYKGKVVLLDFWIFHCGYCIASVPKLNLLQEKYKNKNFKLITVNVYDSRELIQLYTKTQKTKFQILYKGEDAAQKYGMFGFPTAVLIDKDGKVIYSGSFDSQKLDDLIDKSL
ncbi:MAG: TlpA family protein disulfide reductase [Pyrinomonadaceae bacterium]